jgi:hypothetical protein
VPTTARRQVPGSGLSALCTVPGGIHHSVVVVRDLEASLRFYRLSFFVDIDATLGRLAALGLGGPPRRITQPTPLGPVTLATVRAPDGLLVLLTPGSITRSA